MARDKLNVINVSLAYVGEEPLTSLTTPASQQTKRQKQANVSYEQSVLEMFDLPVEWAYFRTRAELSQYGTDPAFGYDYQYTLPDNCRRIICTVDEDGDTIQYKYDREIIVDSAGKAIPVILCDEEECRIRYIVYVADPAKWPAYFAKLCSLILALKISEPLTAKQQRFNQLYIWYRDALNDAKSANGFDCGGDVDDYQRNLDYGNNDVVEGNPTGQVTEIVREII